MKRKTMIVLSLCLIILQGCTSKKDSNTGQKDETNNTARVSKEKNIGDKSKDKIQTNEKSVKITQINEPDQSEAESSIYMSLGDGTATIISNNDTNMKV